MVSFAASGPSQLKVAGTLRRAVRELMLTSWLRHSGACLPLNLPQLAIYPQTRRTSIAVAGFGPDRLHQVAQYDRLQ